MGTNRESDILQLLDAIYEAAFEPARWSDALRACRGLYDCHAGKVGSVDLTTGASTTLALQGIDPVIHDAWEEEFADQDVWAQAGMKALSENPTNRTYTGGELVDPDDLHRAAVYQEILRRCEVEHLVSTVLATTPSTIAFMALYERPAREPFDRRDRDLHDWVGRHARRAFELGSMVQRERDRTHSLLERLPCAAFVCEADGRIVLSNLAAEQLLRSGSGLVARQGRLAAGHAQDRDAFARALSTATSSSAGQSPDGGTTLQVRREVERAPLFVQVDPIPPAGAGAVAFGATFVAPSALVLASDPEARTLLPEEALISAFRITPAQARVLASLCAGEALNDYADRTGIARETARFHVKQLFQATGTHRQTDLVRIALESVVRLTARQGEGDAG